MSTSCSASTPRRPPNKVTVTVQSVADSTKTATFTVKVVADETPTPGTPIWPLREELKQLEDAIAKAEAEKLNQDDYTADSWKAYANALAQAKKVLAKENATSTEVQDAIRHLTEARKALVKVSADGKQPGAAHLPHSASPSSASGSGCRGGPRRRRYRPDHLAQAPYLTPHSQKPLTDVESVRVFCNRGVFLCFCQLLGELTCRDSGWLSWARFALPVASGVLSRVARFRLRGLVPGRGRRF